MDVGILMAWLWSGTRGQRALVVSSYLLSTCHERETKGQDTTTPLDPHHVEEAHYPQSISGGRMFLGRGRTSHLSYTHYITSCPSNNDWAIAILVDVTRNTDLAIEPKPMAQFTSNAHNPGRK